MAAAAARGRMAVATIPNDNLTAEPADPQGPKPSDRVRLRRLVTYEGDRRWLEETLARSQPVRMLPGGNWISIVTIDPFPVVVVDPTPTIAAAAQGEILRELLGEIKSIRMGVDILTGLAAWIEKWVDALPLSPTEPRR
jgi:hypothetical protein